VRESYRLSWTTSQGVVGFSTFIGVNPHSVDVNRRSAVE
jgi:hypothetical protein